MADGTWYNLDVNNGVGNGVGDGTVDGIDSDENDNGSDSSDNSDSSSSVDNGELQLELGNLSADVFSVNTEGEIRIEVAFLDRLYLYLRTTGDETFGMSAEQKYWADKFVEFSDLRSYNVERGSTKVDFADSTHSIDEETGEILINGEGTGEFGAQYKGDINGELVSIKIDREINEYFKGNVPEESILNGGPIVGDTVILIGTMNGKECEDIIKRLTGL